MLSLFEICTTGVFVCKTKHVELCKEKTCPGSAGLDFVNAYPSGRFFLLKDKMFSMN